MKSGPHPRQKLTAISVKRITKPGRHADGNGLYLHVDESGAKRWVLRTHVQGRRTDLGLGSADLVPLIEAREKAVQLRKAAREGRNPAAERRAEKRRVPTFEEAAKKVHQEKLPTFKNEKHAAQWISSLNMYAFPTIGSKLINSVTTSDLADVLLPIWTEKHETASRVRQRITKVLRWAKAHGFIDRNPADDLDPALPSYKAPKTHFASIDHRKMPEFFRLLKNGPGSEATKLGIELVILTCLRTSEVRLAKWEEINWNEKIWTIPPERQKKTGLNEEHVVPLTSRSIEVLKRLQELSKGSEFLLPGQKPTQATSNMTLLKALKQLDEKATVHGFRATARTWAAEETDHGSDIVEKVLAHTIRDKVQAAYQRGNLLEKRLKFMIDWENYLQSPSYEQWKASRNQGVGSS